MVVTESEDSVSLKVVWMPGGGVLESSSLWLILILWIQMGKWVCPSLTTCSHSHNCRSSTVFPEIAGLMPHPTKEGVSPGFVSCDSS